MRTHGMKNTQTYRAWSRMKKRCLNPRSSVYQWYGGRGIQVCERWKMGDGFKSFLADMGVCPSSHHSLDRLDPNGDYTPENCQWSTKSEQSRHRTDNHLLTHNGTTLCLTDWAERVGLSSSLLSRRLRAGWTIDRALTTPRRNQGKGRRSRYKGNPPRTVRHGMSNTSEYEIWCRMQARCYNANCQDYPNYGGRGISVCDRWRLSFEEFFRDMGSRPSSEHSLDRIDSNGNYNPDNCRWATRRQQARNKRNTRKLQFQGKTQSVQDWAEELGLKPAIIHRRLHDGWSVKRALSET